MAIHGPAKELAKMKETTDPLGAKYYEFQCGYTNLEKLSGDGEKPATFCTIQPTFKVNDVAAVEKWMQPFVNGTKSEKDLIYYAWTLDKVNLKLFCREAYVDGDAVNAHLANVGPDLTKALEESKIISLESISIHGPADQVDKTVDGTKGFGTAYFKCAVDDNAFIKFST